MMIKSDVVFVIYRRNLKNNIVEYIAMTFNQDKAMNYCLDKEIYNADYEYMYRAVSVRYDCLTDFNNKEIM